jgi:mono/diheme cytochrome c family protein
MSMTRLLALLILCASVAGAQTPAQQEAEGARVFSSTCAACHQANGMGSPEQYPPLAGSGWVTGSERRFLRIVLHGLTGEVDVEGETFSAAMPGWGATLKDAEIAAVASYVRTHFGNHAPPVSAATVALVRKEYLSRTTPWTAVELAAAERTTSISLPCADSAKRAPATESQPGGKSRGRRP